MRILFVCLGNICRSPTAEGVMRRLIAEAGLDGEIEVESAGTGSWHLGHPPDSRATTAAAARGIDLAGEARQVTRDDFGRFDLLIAMDRANRDALLELAPDDKARGLVFLLREFGCDRGARRAKRSPAAVEAANSGGELDVPDPYYGGDEGFEEVLDIVERSCEALLEEVRARLPAA
jgi:protein-tyrosine phosphatase